MNLLKLIGGPLLETAADLFKSYQDGKLTKEQLRFEIETLAERHDQEVKLLAGEIIKTEAKSEHWITASWRPIAALMMTACIALNLIVAPLATALGFPFTYTLPPEVWTTFNLMLGGYVIGRSGEKMMQTYKEK